MPAHHQARPEGGRFTSHNGSRNHACAAPRCLQTTHLEVGGGTGPKGEPAGRRVREDGSLNVAAPSISSDPCSAQSTQTQVDECSQKSQRMVKGRRDDSVVMLLKQQLDEFKESALPVLMEVGSSGCRHWRIPMVHG